MDETDHRDDNQTDITKATHAGPPDRSASRVWSVGEAATLLGISRAHAYELVARDGFPHVRLGRRIVVPKHALDALLMQNGCSPKRTARPGTDNEVPSSPFATWAGSFSTSPARSSVGTQPGPRRRNYDPTP